MKQLTLLATSILTSVVLIVIWWNRQGVTPSGLVPTLTGEPEYCLSCHADLPEISPSHPVETFGCVICHGGERLALDADLAHSTMRGGNNPSQLEVVTESCGGNNCHDDVSGNNRQHIQRVLTSIQATYAGAIANIRFTFGDQTDLMAKEGIYAIRDWDGQSDTGTLELDKFTPTKSNSPAIQSFNDNCLYCHISANPFGGLQYSRISGCSACHTPSSKQDLITSGQDDNRAPVHRLTTVIPYTQCNTCHNRGNYDLREMQFLARSDRPTDRLHDYYQPIAQFVRCEWTLDCIDCHTRLETMGDGDIYSNQKEIQYVQCRTCHGTIVEPPLTKEIKDAEDLALRMAFINPVIDLKVGDTIIVTQKGEPMWNVRLLPDGKFEQFAKFSGQRFLFRPVIDTGCLQNPDEQESKYCHQCHAVER